MKKILSLIVAASSILASQAYAKTEGGYFGVEALRSDVKVKTTSTLASDNTGDSQPFYNQNKKDSAYGFGVNYKYAINFNNFFIAPAISYEYLNNEIKSDYTVASDEYVAQSLKLKNSISLKANIGYDISDKFAFYIPVGVSRFRYDIKTTDVSPTLLDETVIDSKKSYHKSAAFIGLGFSYEPVKNLVINLEYNKYQDLKLNSARATLDGGQLRSKTNIDIAKVGVSFKF